MKNVITIIIVLASIITNAQNTEIAKTFYRQAKESFEKVNYIEALKLLEVAKENLNGSTNPDILYLEGRTRMISDTNLNKTKKILQEFLDKTDEIDERRVVVSHFLRKLSLPFATYDNGNKLKDFFHADDYIPMNNEDGKNIGSFIITKRDDDNLPLEYNIVYHNPKVLNDTRLQAQYYKVINNKSILRTIGHGYKNLNNNLESEMSVKYKTPSKPLGYYDNYTTEIIIDEMVYEDSLVSKKLKEFIKYITNIKDINWGIITEFKLIHPKIKFNNYYLSNDLQNIYRYKTGKNKYIYNKTNYAWEKIKN